MTSTADSRYIYSGNDSARRMEDKTCGGVAVAGESYVSRLYPGQTTTQPALLLYGRHQSLPPVRNQDSLQLLQGTFFSLGLGP